MPPSFPGPKFQQMVIGRVIGFFLRKFPKLPLLGGTLTQPTFLPSLKHDEILNLLNETSCFCLLARMLACSALWCFLLPCAEVPAPGRRLDIVPDIVSHAAQPVLKTRHQSLWPWTLQRAEQTAQHIWRLYVLNLQSWIP